MESGSPYRRPPTLPTNSGWFGAAIDFHNSINKRQLEGPHSEFEKSPDLCRSFSNEFNKVEHFLMDDLGRDPDAAYKAVCASCKADQIPLVDAMGKELKDPSGKVMYMNMTAKQKEAFDNFFYKVATAYSGIGAGTDQNLIPKNPKDKLNFYVEKYFDGKIDLNYVENDSHQVKTLFTLRDAHNRSVPQQDFSSATAASSLAVHHHGKPQHPVQRQAQTQHVSAPVLARQPQLSDQSPSPITAVVPYQPAFPISPGNYSPAQPMGYYSGHPNQIPPIVQYPYSGSSSMAQVPYQIPTSTPQTPYSVSSPPFVNPIATNYGYPAAPYSAPLVQNQPPCLGQYAPVSDPAVYGGYPPSGVSHSGYAHPANPSNMPYFAPAKSSPYQTYSPSQPSYNTYTPPPEFTPGY